MQIIVKGKDSHIFAAFINALLMQWGVPINRDISTGELIGRGELLAKARSISESLESPVEIIAKPGKDEILVIDPEVDPKWPVVKGTWVTVRQIADLIIEGHDFEGVLRTHPELCDSDIRAALAYVIEQNEQDIANGNRQTIGRITGQETHHSVVRTDTFVGHKSATPRPVVQVPGKTT